MIAGSVIGSGDIPSAGPMCAVGHPSGFRNLDGRFDGGSVELLSGVEGVGAAANGFRETIDADFEFVVFSLDAASIAD